MPALRKSHEARTGSKGQVAPVPLPRVPSLQRLHRSRNQPRTDHGPLYRDHASTPAQRLELEREPSDAPNSAAIDPKKPTMVPNNSMSSAATRDAHFQGCPGRGTAKAQGCAPPHHACTECHLLHRQHPDRSTQRPAYLRYASAPLLWVQWRFKHQLTTPCGDSPTTQGPLHSATTTTVSSIFNYSLTSKGANVCTPVNLTVFAFSF